VRAPGGRRRRRADRRPGRPGPGPARHRDRPARAARAGVGPAARRAPRRRGRPAPAGGRGGGRLPRDEPSHRRAAAARRRAPHARGVPAQAAAGCVRAPAGQPVRPARPRGAAPRGAGPLRRREAAHVGRGRAGRHRPGRSAGAPARHPDRPPGAAGGRRGARLRRRRQRRAALTGRRLGGARPSGAVVRRRRALPGRARDVGGRAPGLRPAPRRDVPAGRGGPLPLGVRPAARRVAGRPRARAADARTALDPRPALRAARGPAQQRVRLPGAAGRPLAGRTGVPARRRGPPDAPLRRAGPGRRCARRRQPDLEARRGPARARAGGAAADLRARAAAARPGAGPARRDRGMGDDRRRWPGGRAAARAARGAVPGAGRALVRPRPRDPAAG
ncbi:MAG: monooxygenase, FAD-binding, partial [uncultured Frankineae bacterium]